MVTVVFFIIEPSTVTVCASNTTAPVPLGARVILLLAPSVIVIVPELVPPFVFKTKSSAPPVVTVNDPAPLDEIVAAEAASPTVTVSAANSTSPSPLGARVMLPSTPSVIVIVPEFVPPFVFKTKSEAPPVVTVNDPAPLDEIVAAEAASPTVTVSAANSTSPSPLGARVMLPSTPSVIVIVPEFVPLFVFKTKS